MTEMSPRGQVYIVGSVTDRNHRGWLKIHVVGVGTEEICYGTRIALISSTLDEQYVKILDGKWKNYYAHIPFRYSPTPKSTYEASYLIQPKKHRYDQVKLTVNRKEATLFAEGVGFLKLVNIPTFLDRKEYFVRIPSYPHREKTKSEYRNEEKHGSRFADMWFRLDPMPGVNRHTFLHFGKYSEGCVTISIDEGQGAKWNRLCVSLLGSRISDLYLAKLKVC